MSNVATTALVAAGRFSFPWRKPLFPLLFLVVFLPGPRLFDTALQATAVGFAVAARGQLVRTATIGIEYVIRGGCGGRAYAEELVVATVVACQFAVIGLWAMARARKRAMKRVDRVAAGGG